jgi:hypothetical protein
LEVIDFWNERQVGLTSTMAAYGLQLYGQYAVVVGDGSSSLQVVDTSLPAAPVVVGRYGEWLHGNNVRVVGHYAFLASDWGGVDVIDLKNPRSPIRRGGYSTPGPARGVEVAGNYAYVAEGSKGFEVLEIRHAPSMRLDHPTRIGNQIAISWIGDPGVKLQRTMDLQKPLWRDVPGSQITNRLTLVETNRTGFFRLIQP